MKYWMLSQNPERRRYSFPVEKDDRWGFIDRTGKIVVPLQFDSANDFLKASPW